MKAIIALLGALLITGCSTLSNQSNLAQEGEWEMIGEMDGKSGQHLKTKFELTKLGTPSDTDISNYKTGYKTGLNQFCTPENGYKMGLNGKSYRGQCAQTSTEERFVQRWYDGNTEYILNDDMFAGHDD